MHWTSQTVIALYIDAKAAFNSLDRSLLIDKLMSQYQLHPFYIKTIHNYMSDTVFRFKDHTTYYNNCTGIIQGGPVMPLLYGAYQNDIADIIYLPFLLYADDLVVYISGTNLDDMTNILKTQMNAIQKWYHDNNMLINYDKTKYQIFHKSKDPLPQKYCNNPLIIDDHIIEQVTSFKYLGVHLDSNLNFRTHYVSVLSRVSCNIGFLYGIKRYLTDKLLSIFISCHVHSIIDYGINIWGVKTEVQLNVIQKKINSLLVNFFFTSYSKNLRKQKKSAKFQDIITSIDYNQLLSRANLLSICERRDLYLLKYAFLNLSNLKSSTSQQRTWPLLVIPRCRTSLALNNIITRAMKLWNSLPRYWIHNMSYNVFVQKCKDLLIKKRSTV